MILIFLRRTLTPPLHLCVCVSVCVCVCVFLWVSHLFSTSVCVCVCVFLWVSHLFSTSVCVCVYGVCVSFCVFLTCFLLVCVSVSGGDWAVTRRRAGLGLGLDSSGDSNYQSHV